DALLICVPFYHQKHREMGRIFDLRPILTSETPQNGTRLDKSVKRRRGSVPFYQLLEFASHFI
ncbi:MAG: hypothetical protein ACO1OC_07490, partial [Tuberibacillus sp.]